MPHEPEKLLLCLSGRAEKWQKAVSYRQVQCDRGRTVSAVRYNFPAATAAAQSLRIAFFSDLHFSNANNLSAVIAETADHIDGFKPHYLISGGDLAGYVTELDALPSVLGEFRHLAPVRLAIPGNWEGQKGWLPHDYWRKLYAESGFRWLDNEFFQDDHLTFYGATDPSGGKLQAPCWPDVKGQRILLAHRPDTVLAFDSRKLPDALPTLSLCGHTHGGQIRLPFLGPLASASTYGKFFDYGVFEHRAKDCKMVISSGLNHRSFPFRFNCRREVLLITLV